MGQQKVAFNQMVNTAESKPWRFMMIGGVAAGKTTLLRALENKSPELATKTQMVDYNGWGIDTPGEFIEGGPFRRVLVSTAFDAQLLVGVQDASRETLLFPPNYFLMFPQPTIGVVTKIDRKEADIDRAKRVLTDAGITGPIFCVSALTGVGISELREFLMSGSR